MVGKNCILLNVNGLAKAIQRCISTSERLLGVEGVSYSVCGNVLNPTCKRFL